MSAASTNRRVFANHLRGTLICVGILASYVRCGGDRATPPQPSNKVPTSSVPLYQAALTLDTAVRPGQQTGYGVMAGVASSFRLVWTGLGYGEGSHRLFSGSVYTSGHFLTVIPGCRRAECPLEASDSLSAPIMITDGQRVDFSALGADDLDGFDFMIDTEPAFFELYIDGRIDTHLVFLSDALSGADLTNVSQVPFGVVSR